ncbi:MAG: GNAT family N-acetyltransferase [Gammaproteobacteria bacterium]|nr:GNAT family N-acetyltransferase [Gammaproteobacteria bacterium]
MTARSARILHGIDEIDAETWDRCANPPGEPFNPFLAYSFLHALEASGSTTARTGWQPFHLALEERGSVLGVVPMYVKGHSQGEYVFDYAWADAWHRAGGKYYPKLQGSVPFTPATGRRLLGAGGDAEIEQALLGACVQVADQVGVSSLHFTFMPERQWRLAGESGYLRRMDQQYHWHNPGYDTFEAFLADLSSKKRKNLRRERRTPLPAGITVEWVTGADLTEAHWDDFYRFYMDTGSRKWGSPYLTREFFSRISDSMAEHTLLVMCSRDGRYIAGALNFIGGDALYGRNWGCVEDHRFLHFEACYYQAIDFAITHKLARVEAGAQGPHKVARGYLPQATYSAHWIRDPGLRAAVARFLSEERDHVQQDIDWIERHSPFKSGIELDAIRGIDGGPFG